MEDCSWQQTTNGNSSLHTNAAQLYCFGWRSLKWIPKFGREGTEICWAAIPWLSRLERRCRACVVRKVTGLSPDLYSIILLLPYILDFISWLSYFFYKFSARINVLCRPIEEGKKTEPSLSISEQVIVFWVVYLGSNNKLLVLNICL